jgi:hypothetical protein
VFHDSVCWHGVGAGMGGLPEADHLESVKAKVCWK